MNSAHEQGLNSHIRVERNHSKRFLTPTDLIEDYLFQKYDTRYNVITNRAEYRKKGEGNFTAITEYDSNSLLSGILKEGIACTSTRLNDILNSDFSSKYDLFRDYFNSLPTWDGQIDYIQALADTVTTTNQELWSRNFKKWLIGMVACVLSPSEINHTAIIFTGKQRIGKTTWLNNLMPQELKDHMFSGMVSSDNKDSLVHLGECMLIQMDELEGLNRKNIESLKHLMTSQIIRLRRAYGRNFESIIRRASFAGSTNNVEFLIDPTGSRRFLCHEVTGIEYNHEISMANVYTQALHEYHDGFRFWFDQEETEEISRHNQRFQVATFEEEFILKYLKHAPRGEGEFMSASDVFLYLNARANNTLRTSAVTIGKTLVKLGFEKTKFDGRYGYYVVENK